MSGQRRNRTVLAVLLLISLVLLTIDYRQGEDGALAAVQRTALSLVAPAQDGLAAVVRPVENLVGSMRDLWSLREENATLQSELQRLREGRVSRADIERENASLRELLGMRERLGLGTTGAQVIAQPPGAFGWNVLIDAGFDHGVRSGMAVVNADGLVGKVTEVSRQYARVQLLTNPSAGYAVRIVESAEEGLLTGRGSRPFRLEIPNSEAQVSEGADVVTRSFRGSTIPGGIPIGVVDSSPDPGGRFLAVRPYVDFTRLNLVQVILDAPTHPLDLAPGEVVDEDSEARPPAPPTESPEPPRDDEPPGETPGETPDDPAGDPAGETPDDLGEDAPAEGSTP